MGNSAATDMAKNVIDGVYLVEERVDRDIDAVIDVDPLIHYQELRRSERCTGRPKPHKFSYRTAYVTIDGNGVLLYSYSNQLVDLNYEKRVSQ